MAGLEASRALEKCEKGVQENAKTLKESSLTAQCYHKIRRLHDDKISSKGIAAEVGCSIQEVQAALWKPTASNAFTLFKSSEAVRARTAAAGVPFSEMTKLVSKLWDDAKRNGTSSPFEVQAIEEKHAVMQESEKWKGFLADWLASRQTAPSPAASRERLKPQPVVKKSRKAPSGPPRQTLVQVRNKELKVIAEEAAARRARWFEQKWEHVRPFLPLASQDPNSPFARKLLRKDLTACLDPCMEPLPTQAQPRSIVGSDGFTMYPYQLEGMTWMLNQHRQGVGGILGDEMGLGKTLQVISFLAAIKDAGEVGPHLIVAPLSVLPTWERECKRWCPSLTAVQFHGSEQTRKELWTSHLCSAAPKPFHVVLTTYEMLTAATSMLTHRTYNYVILDEAQRIKNESSLIGQAVRKLRSVHKLLITGTPLQNDLHELWALLNFMFPDVFASSEQFDLAFKRTVTETRIDLDLVCAAHQLLEPLMLRRLKKDVQKHLPKKTVLTIWCPITDMQKFWYRKCLESSGCAKDLMLKPSVPAAADDGGAAGADDGGGAAGAAAPASGGHGGGKNKLMNLLIQLRKVVNHPFMFPEADLNPHETGDSIVTSSAKMMVLDRILNKLKAQGRRALVYSQFTTMLDVIQDYCQFVGHGFMRLDGSTCLARRKYEIKMFNSKRGNQLVYLLSTRAGALGITLTGADTVIMYDSDWNPTWDRQAHDRVHRIGQEREVTIYQLLCKDTVEQRIFQRAAQKTSLNELVLRDDTDTKSTNKEDVLSSGEVRKMLRCGVVKLLDDESTSITEETVDELIEAAHARGDQTMGQGPEEDDSLDDAKDVEAVDVFNQKLTQIRTFGGKKFDLNKDAMRSIADQWVAELAASGARRERVSTVDSVGGYQVKKINRSAAPAEKVVGAKKNKVLVKYDDTCLYCGERGATAGAGVSSLSHRVSNPLHTCKAGSCHRTFHEACLDAYLKREQRAKTYSMAGSSCTQHQCSLCMGKAAGRGGLIFRCWKCPVAFCGECLPDEFEPLDVRSGPLIDQVGALASTVEYLLCQSCTKNTSTTRKMPRPTKVARPVKSAKAKIWKDAPAWLEPGSLVEVEYEGEWWQAKAVELKEQFNKHGNPCSAKIKFEFVGGSKEDVEWLTIASKRIRSSRSCPIEAEVGEEMQAKRSKDKGVKRKKPDVSKTESMGARKAAKVKMSPPRMPSPAKPSRAQAKAAGSGVQPGKKGSKDVSKDVSMADDWHTQGPFMKARVRRAIEDAFGTVTAFADGTVVGFLPLEHADYISELTGRPSALWHVQYDDARIGQEDLEEVEVIDAIESYRSKNFEATGSKSPDKKPSPRKQAPPKAKASPPAYKGKDAVVFTDVFDDEGISCPGVGGARQKAAALSSRETPNRPLGKGEVSTPPLPGVVVQPVKLAVDTPSAHQEPEHL